ncbi:HAD-IB family phosphatase [Phototrophicus methaneseepsis]|uniref:phosphoserine phosphatase n=1 Tax=Phototrophicus methaneseepsis TaxID=2710758 RepID=A0A7S8IDX5_9CHLR|nr:HAD-IB family phosphatase [Phototrophicus methaneseepsis]QPC81972.1 HAD-IB family phosphatase [Phototrophicus methaneseepsis]
MQTTRWTSYDLIFFDCDSTLSTIEGIDELAKLKGKEGRVGILTDKAMNGDLDLSEVYGKRLKAIRPTRGQLKAVEERYWETVVEDAIEVIAALQYIGKEVFIISGGLVDAVRGFGRRLGVAPEHIRAVELEYNQLSGDWWRYHEPETQHKQTYMEYVEGPLTISSGKPEIIAELAGSDPGRRFMIGDGSSDLATQPVVDLFVGYGGVVARDKVQNNSDVFIKALSLAPVLPLATGPAGYEKVLGTPYQSLFEKGIEMVLSSDVLFKSADQRAAFAAAFEDVTGS